ncbi:MAG: hypothetical protein DPW09_28010 [Anaerolineae bacterium]|nr:DUF1638 domain-containing protein [Anaerolineales bacterium]MCQ3977293.1 hypothetical protein [Anaerolineae bacterium]
MKTLFIACGALAKETKELIDKYNWPVDLKALPALHHMTPLKITADLDVMLGQLRADYDRVIVVYGECGATGIDEVLAKHNVVRVSGPHCYEMYAGAAHFTEMMAEEPGTFFLTDWLLRAYEKAVLGGLGLDKHPQLAPLYFGNYRRLVYLSQSPTEKLLAKAQAIAASMDWEFEHRAVGYGELEERLVALMNSASPSDQLLSEAQEILTYS